MRQSRSMGGTDAAHQSALRGGMSVRSTRPRSCSGSAAMAARRDVGTLRPIEELQAASRLAMMAFLITVNFDLNFFFDASLK